jgi:imidazolonepropionase
MKADLIVNNIGQLVTCASDGPKRGDAMRDAGIIANCAVAVKSGLIAAIGSPEEIRGEFECDQVIDAEGRAAFPGFVDPHTHIVYAGDRLNEFELKIKGAAYLDILESGGGIVSTVRNTREALEDELVEAALERLDKMLACGTTTAEVKTGYGLDTDAELKMLAAIERLDEMHAIDIVPTFLAAHTVPPEYLGDAGSYVDLICSEMLPRAWQWFENSRFQANGIPFFADVFCEKGAFDLEQSRRLLTAARQLGFGVKAHVDQFTNLGGSRLAIELGAVSIDHLDEISDEEIRLLADSKTIGIVIPTENFSAGKTAFADARKMIDAGCAVAVSTDYNPGSAPCPSQAMAIAIACRYQKLLPAEAINAATINAAHAVGLGDRIGSIEVGKHADLMVIDALDHRAIAYEFGYSPVRTVVKRGAVVQN